jgi:hypothetical protein
MLADLGMKGQPTLGKAKSIKEKREMAAELSKMPFLLTDNQTKSGRSRQHEVCLEMGDVVAKDAKRQMIRMILLRRIEKLCVLL